MEEILNSVPQKTEEEKIMLQLKESWVMYERTKKETMKQRKEQAEKLNIPFPDQNTIDTMKLLESRQKQIVEKFEAYGGNPADLVFVEEPEVAKKSRRQILDEIIASKEEILEKDKPFNITLETPAAEPVKKEEPKKVERNTQQKNSAGALFDYVALPSMGKCYKKKLEKLPVYYLTAFDENLMVSPNLYEDGSFIDELIKLKLMNNQISPDELVTGDRDAIILWLRASGYGVEYPLTVTDNEGNTFQTIADLSQIKFKKFTLEGDEDGHFDFELPLSKDKIKFRFLTYADLKALKKLEEFDDIALKKDKLEEIVDYLETYAREESGNKLIHNKLENAIKAVKEYNASIDENGSTGISHLLTDKMAMSIVSVNDITDRNYINEYVENMNVRDSWAFRRYIIDNEPGLDFNIEVERPESLGGGSVTLFLELDKDIFFTVAE